MIRPADLVAAAYAPFLCAATAQTVTGSLSGAVTDHTGAVIAGAKITATEEATGAIRSGTTGETGAFVLVALPPGTYTVRVEALGFRPHERRGILLTANERLALGTFELSVGQITETVPVQAQGPSLATESADNTPRLSQSQLRDIMARGRDIVNLLRVLPGVSQVTGGADSLCGRYRGLVPNISGSRDQWNNIMLDGQAANDVDILQAFCAATSADAMMPQRPCLRSGSVRYGFWFEVPPPVWRKPTCPGRESNFYRLGNSAGRGTGQPRIP